MKLKSWLLVLCSFCAIAVTGCAADQPSEPTEILIGGFGPMTGTTATFGISTRNGIATAVDEVNKAGGLLGKQVRVIVEDTQGKPEEAQTVATRLITRDRVVALLGEVGSPGSLAAAPVAQQSGIPMISPTSTTPRLTEIGDYIFRVCFIDPFQGLVMAKFAANTLKVKRVAILRDIKNDYSVGLADVFIENYTMMGGTIVSDESYSEGDIDFSAQLTSIRSKNPEAIFLPGYYTEVGLVARQAKRVGLNVPLLGGDGFDSPKLSEIGGADINGSYFSNHYSIDDPNPAVQKFVADYKGRFNEVPDAMAALAYDSAMVLFDAMRRANTTEPAKVRDAIAQTKDYPGVTGTITIDAQRNPVKPAVVLEVKDGKFEYVETINP